MVERFIVFFIMGLFSVEHNSRLEKKAWFRFVKVTQGILIFCVMGIAALTTYMLSDAKRVETATLHCKDGSTWNAIDERSSYGSYKDELDMYEKCGLCNYRLADNQYRLCEVGTQSKLLFDSYSVTKTYSREHSTLKVIGWSSLVLVGGLLVVKILAKLVIYVFGGSEQNDQ